MNPAELVRVVEERLAALVGEDEARATVRDARRELTLGVIRDANDQVRFADFFIRRGGFTAILGRTLKMEALTAMRELQQRASG